MTETWRRAGFHRYVALGDSVSIDDYPAVDWQELRGLPAPFPGLGAASLLHRNHDEAWPEFRGRALRTSSPDLAFECLATDGARTRDVLEDQLPRLGRGDPRPTLVTLTVGGNDLLQLLSRRFGPEDAEDVLGRIGEILLRLESVFPERTVLVATVYDPTDGGPELMGVRLGEPEHALLARVNDGIRDLCSARPGVVLADVAAHFRGHGLSAAPDDRWYWPHAPIEPSARGASEVRRLWLNLLSRAEPRKAHD
jgi:lysophospholipase L1-like esterase